MTDYVILPSKISLSDNEKTLQRHIVQEFQKVLGDSETLMQGLNNVYFGMAPVREVDRIALSTFDGGTSALHFVLNWHQGSNAGQNIMYQRRNFAFDIDILELLRRAVVRAIGHTWVRPPVQSVKVFHGDDCRDLHIVIARTDAVRRAKKMVSANKANVEDEKLWTLWQLGIPDSKIRWAMAAGRRVSSTGCCVFRYADSFHAKREERIQHEVQIMKTLQNIPTLVLLKHVQGRFAGSGDVRAKLESLRSQIPMLDKDVRDLITEAIFKLDAKTWQADVRLKLQQIVDVCIANGEKDA